MSGATNERIPFLFSAETCEWDKFLGKGIEEWTNGLKKQREEQGESYAIEVDEFFNGLRNSVVNSLKKCDEKILAGWEQIYKHSYDIKSNREKVIARDATINQQTAALAGGIPAAGAGGLACGLGLFPCLVKLVSKFKG